MKKKGIALKASSSIQEESDKEDLNEIKEDDDFSFFVNMSLATLFGTLQEHEMELMRLNQHE